MLHHEQLLQAFAALLPVASGDFISLTACIIANDTVISGWTKVRNIVNIGTATQDYLQAAQTSLFRSQSDIRLSAPKDASQIDTKGLDAH